MERFVNPYTFVPLRPVERGPALGHDGRNAEKRFSGSLTVEWRLRTPLLVGPRDRAEHEGWIKGGEFLRLPGSSVRGAVRSVHEALFNGCLRILDEEFVPAYRVPANEEKDPRWTLGLVTEGRDGRATRIMPYRYVRWVQARRLKAAWGAGLPKSGDVCRIDSRHEPSTLGREQYVGPLAVTDMRPRPEGEPPARLGSLPEPGTQILLATDTSARQGRWRRDKDGCWWAVGDEPIDRQLPVTEQASFRFAAACRGSNDRRILETDERREWRDRPCYTDVVWKPNAEDLHTEPVARRTMASGFLFAGDVVWVRVVAAQVVDIRLSQIWRRTAGASSPGPSTGTRDRPGVAARLGAEPDAATPCRPHWDDDLGMTDRLCLSCGVFGAIDAAPPKEERGPRKTRRQEAYAGHVRFGAATYHQGSRKVSTVRLTPLGSPQPGSGNFYLQLPELLSDERSFGDVGAQWGSDADRDEKGRLAGLRGRKFYWHADPDAQKQRQGLDRARYVASPSQERTKTGAEKKVGGEAQLVACSEKRPLVVRSTVTFDQLDRIGLASLLAAVDPARLLASDGETKTYGIRLGGGKPLGLGTAVPRIVWEERGKCVIHTTAGRYQGGGDVAADWKVPAQEDFEPRAGELPLEEMRSVLDVDALGEHADLVAYPPGASWANAHTREFRESYRWFEKADGTRLKTRRTTWQVLPDVLDEDPTLPIDPREARR